MTEPRSTQWQHVERAHGDSKKAAKLGHRAFFVMLGASVFVIPAQCATLHVGDYGPRTTKDTATVNQVALLIGGAFLLLILSLQLKSLVHALGALKALAPLSASPPTGDSPEATRERDYLTKTSDELRNGQVAPAIAWLFAAGIGLVCVVSWVFFPASE